MMIIIENNLALSIFKFTLPIECSYSVSYVLRATSISRTIMKSEKI